MLFFFEEYRFASKLLKRRQQLQLALAWAEARQLPEGVVEVYRVTLPSPYRALCSADPASWTADVDLCACCTD